LTWPGALGTRVMTICGSDGYALLIGRAALCEARDRGRKKGGMPREGHRHHSLCEYAEIASEIMTDWCPYFKVSLPGRTNCLLPCARRHVVVDNYFACNVYLAWSSVPVHSRCRDNRTSAEDIIGSLASSPCTVRKKEDRGHYQGSWGMT
jgi:hypothetical protein